MRRLVLFNDVRKKIDRIFCFSVCVMKEMKRRMCVLLDVNVVLRFHAHREPFEVQLEWYVS